MEAETLPDDAVAAPGAGAVPPTPPFFRELAGVINAGTARGIVLAGEVHDLFHLRDATDATGEAASGAAAVGERPAGAWVPLVDFLVGRCSVPGMLVLVAELNGPLRLHAHGGAAAGWERLRDAWVAWRGGVEPSDEDILAQLAEPGKAGVNRQTRLRALRAQFSASIADVVGKPTVALELLRQLSLCSRSRRPGGEAYLAEDLLILVEAADLTLPAGDGDVARLNPADRHRVAVVEDWFADPGFANGRDSVVLLAGSASGVHPRVAALPTVRTISVDAPGRDTRLAFLESLQRGREAAGRPAARLPRGAAALADRSAGLSLHALRELLLTSAHAGEPVDDAAVVAAVERFLEKKLGEGVVGFSKPEHRLADVLGNGRLKAFLRDELLPRFRSTGEDALPGAAVAGPIGGGKTFIFEAVAAELGLPVLVLKNIRSQWFGQTDAVFEKLRAVLVSLGKVVIFVDEADTQFGGVGGDSHATERRLTGKVQQMMSDPTLRGRVIWLLMTARIERLSADIRRPGRVGDLILPVLDPEPGSADAADFLRWAAEPALGATPDDAALAELSAALGPTSAAAFGALRSRLGAEAARAGGPLGLDAVVAVVRDQLPADIAAERRYQTLQALLNTTRRALLPDPAVTEDDRAAWAVEAAALRRAGIGA
ncbi:AAA family ATPase [Phycisphaera mikurensis]|uniref:ATPase AAA-type core domain-containing protein n=1 Tax=Phycisphaera mikurensis (strain NBRC 102666 / KCTC 22515 / FYK2301M01) TaxID=1142394 RepID=I0IBJ1_PHYMF|nr:AAA family ATPase [Phycisphaera mikurensis]MBB6442840.1 hypothetical protein [Phycisphaera mikurensis]BAM02629.1 hypothetical protein PSMK_04700 [Phycisphaera mikurensis NBRC 102666]